MNRVVMMESVQEQMPAKRWKHTLGVMKTAVELAQRFKGDSEKADLASLLHDYCKYWPVERQKQVLIDAGDTDNDILLFDKQLWHAPAAAIEVSTIFGVEDIEVLNAIRYHTSGRVGMTLLEKIVCLADYMEPGRDFPEVNKIRELAEHSLEKALVAGIDSTICHLFSKGRKVFPLTILARNSLIELIDKE